jgi:hypothetical protein
MRRIVAALPLLLSAPCWGAVHFGLDAGAGQGDAFPLAGAARQSFDTAIAALGPASTLTFESLPVGNSTNLQPSSGVSLLLSGVDPSFNTIDTVLGLEGDSQIVGYNTTVGGTKFVRVAPSFGAGTVLASFTYSQPIQAWGAFITGLGTAAGNLFIEFVGVNGQTFNVVGSSSGGTAYFGYVDSDASIVEVRLSLRNVSGTRDIFGIDDVRSVRVPGPAAGSLLCMAGAAMACSRRRQPVA